jgi:hypothetical protein
VNSDRLNGRLLTPTFKTQQKGSLNFVRASHLLLPSLIYFDNFPVETVAEYWPAA